MDWHGSPCWTSCGALDPDSVVLGMLCEPGAADSAEPVAAHDGLARIFDGVTDGLAAATQRRAVQGRHVTAHAAALAASWALLTHKALSMYQPFEKDLVIQEQMLAVASNSLRSLNLNAAGHVHGTAGLAAL